MRKPSLLILLLLAPAIARAAPAQEGATAERGHGLTTDDAQDGWISLFDGKTTFGWNGATVREGTLTGGATALPFGPFELRADVASGGEVHAGGQAVPVSPGRVRETVEAATPSPIRLGANVSVRSLAIRPLQLAPLPVTSEGADWKVIPHPSLPKERQATWRPVVRDGKAVGVRATGGPGAVEFPSLHGDFVLQVEVNCLSPGSNAGVFFRSRPGDFLNGYEVQVFNAVTHGDPPRQVRYCTGAIDDHQRARRLVSRDGQPFTLTVAAAGPHLATWVNGVQVTDWTDDRPPHDNPRQGLRIAPGTIQLQAHDKGTDVEFTNIRVAPLK
jgi:hypothetical protein